MEIKLKNKGSEIFIPDALSLKEGIERTTHLGISAHADDLEILGYHGILECFGKRDKWFFGIVVTDGAGSPRVGRYERFTDEEMKEIRKKEQKKACVIGEYGGVAFLNYPSSHLKEASNRDVIEDIKEIVSIAKPEIVYTHNLADKHDTHLAVALKTILALRELPPDKKPKKLYGCEVWRSLDWMVDKDKVVLDVSGFPHLESALLGVFDSQIGGGKRYDLATVGRRRANATYLSTHEVDVSESVIYAMEMTPLILDKNLDLKELVSSFVERFKEDLIRKIEKLL
ncbi:MAG: PIG-L deacetylase family protein [Candidatus Aminicenantia bacterium]